MRSTTLTREDVQRQQQRGCSKNCCCKGAATRTLAAKGCCSRQPGEWVDPLSTSSGQRPSQCLCWLLVLPIRREKGGQHAVSANDESGFALGTRRVCHVFSSHRCEKSRVI